MVKGWKRIVSESMDIEFAALGVFFIVKPFPYVSRSRIIRCDRSFSVSGKAVQQIFQIPAAEAYIHLWLKQLDRKSTRLNSSH